MALGETSEQLPRTEAASSLAFMTGIPAAGACLGDPVSGRNFLCIHVVRKSIFTSSFKRTDLLSEGFVEALKPS